MAQFMCRQAKHWAAGLRELSIQANDYFKCFFWEKPEMLVGLTLKVSFILSLGV